MAVDEDLGQPVPNGAFAIVGGHGRLHERGMKISGSAGEVEVRFLFPMIAKPAIATATPAAFDHALHFDPEGRSDLVAFLQDALRDRFALVAVGQPTVRVPLVGSQAFAVVDGVGISFTGGELADRQLYDVAFRMDDGRWQVVAPHAVYGRKSWTDFGIAHITDMHVARRIDGFRGKLEAAGRADAAKLLYNWNDRFRGFVRYANYLHGIGALDVILATGDNYDYQFEDTDDPTGGGNAAFLRDLILGREPGRDFPDVEELRVPIFMVPGNHDYRKHPYGLYFDLHMSDGLRDAVIAVGAAHGVATALLHTWLSGKAVDTVRNNSSYRLSDDDAIILANRVDGVSGDEVQKIQPDKAATMVEVDKDNRPYRQYLGAPGYYVVELGDHRVAMIDSAHDEGIVTEQLAGLLVAKLGRGTEDQDAFVGGSPNCTGVSADALEVVSKALTDTKGLFIVGLHAPLFNPSRDGYGYFLRETQRAVQGEQVHGFLAPRGTAGDPHDLMKEVESDHPTWFAPSHAGRDDRGPDYVKRVSTDDQFRNGVSRGEAEKLMRYLAGLDDSPRAADLVLAGHTHFYNEYRVREDQASGDLAYYMDFYTQNPTNYYPTSFMRSWLRVDPSSPMPPAMPQVDRQDTFIEVMPGAQADANPWAMPFDALNKYMLQVPPYAKPLNSAADPGAWWAEHRPLVLQTGALGPHKKLAFLSGFRVIAVKNNVIDKIHYVSIARLEDHNYQLAWDQAILPETPRSYHYLERSRPMKAPLAVGVPSGFAFAKLGSTNAVYRDGDGHLHELWQKGADAGTSDLTTLASNAIPAAGDPTSYIDPVENLQVVLYRGTDRHVYSMYWSTGEVRRDALSASVDAPRASSDPVGYVGKDGFRHVIYRADDGHLHELWWTGTNPVGHGDITTPIDAPTSAGTPVAYMKPSDGENNVFYRGSDHHIHRLFWLTGTVKDENLSAVARAPEAVGDPAAYYVSHDDSHHVVYRSADGHIHELSWQGNNPVGRGDLTAVTKDAPAAAHDASGDPVAYYSAANKTHHVIYRAADGHLYQLSWTGTATPTCIDLMAYAVAPVAADRPTAFVAGWNTQHVLYRGADNQIHEIRWDEAAAFVHDVINPIGGTLEEIQPLQPVDRGLMDAVRNRGMTTRPR